MQGGPNIINFVDAYKNTEENYIAFVMELVDMGDTDFVRLAKQLTN